MYKEYIDFIIEKVKLLDDKGVIVSLPLKQLPSVLLLMLEIENCNYIDYKPQNTNFIFKLSIKHMNEIFFGLSLTTGHSFLGSLVSFGNNFFAEVFKNKIIKIIGNEIDKQLDKDFHTNNIDLINGIVGYGIFSRIIKNFDLENKIVNSLTDYAPKITNSNEIDFGIAHGISGTLAFLSSSNKSSMINKNLKACCKKIFNLLDESYKNSEWISKKINDTYLKNPYPYSWCYGYTGINISKYFYIKNVQNKDISDFIINWDKQINYSLNGGKFKRYPSIVCHGLSGLLIGKKIFVDYELHKSTDWEPYLYILKENFINQELLIAGSKNSNLSFLDGQISVLLGMISLISPNDTYIERLLFFK